MTTLVLLPGLDGTGDLFAPFCDALGGSLSVIVVRYPADASLDYHELESIAATQLPAEGPLVLLGESFSGPIAIALASKFPERVKGLVLCCSFLLNPRPGLARFLVLGPILPAGRVPTWLTSIFLFGRFGTPQLRTALHAALFKISSATLRARMKAVLSVDASAAFRGTSMPTLYLQATEDRLIPRSAARYVEDVRPEVRVIAIEAPHGLLQAAPVAAAQAVAAFVREVGNALQ